MKFTLYWLHGKKEVIEGSSISNAMNKNYSAGAMAALDFYERGVSDNYEYVDGKWSWTEKRRKELGIE